jgi:serine/threonine protein kinase
MYSLNSDRGGGNNGPDKSRTLRNDLRNYSTKSLEDIKTALKIYKYDLESEIGKGSFGKIYRVKHKSNSDFHVAKVIDTDNDVELIKQINHEINVLTQVNSSYFIKIIQKLELNDGLIIITEWAEMGDLSKYTTQALSEEIAFIIFYSTCRGINALHKKKIVHRDVKLENILLKDNGDIRLCDLGLAKLIGEEDESALTSSFVGSPLYLAPEVIEGRTGLYSIDVWCLGVMLYILVCGKPPFKIKKLEKEEFIEKIVEGELHIPSNTVSSECHKLLTQLLEKDNNKRIKIIDIFKTKWWRVMLQGYSDDNETMKEEMSRKLIKFFKKNENFK